MNKKQVAEWLNVIHDGRLVEIRALGLGRNSKGVASGYFYDYDKAAHHAAKLEKEGAEGIYQTLNEIHPGCYARSPDRVTDSPRYTTKDSDIIRRSWMLIDVDPVRPAGISATDEEIEHARAVSESIGYQIHGYQPAKVVTAESGNGCHILAASEDTDDDIRALLDMFASLYGTPEADIDTSVWNLARITKLYGTLARKGFATSNRPHRRSRIVDIKKQVVK